MNRFLGTALGAIILAWSSSIHAGEWGKVTNEEWELVPTARMANPAAIIVFDQGAMRVEEEGITFERHLRIKVFDAERAKSSIRAGVWTFTGEKLNQLDAQTILSSGKKISIGKKEITQYRLPGFRIDSLDFPDIEDNCIVEYRYRQLHDRFHLLDPWQYQNSLYTVKSTISITLLPGFHYIATYYAVPEENQKAIREDLNRGDYVDEARYTNVMHDIPPYLDEPLAGHKRSYRPSVYFQLVKFESAYTTISFQDDWGMIGSRLTAGYGNYIAEFGLLSQAATMAASTATSIDEKVRMLYEFARDSIATHSDPTGPLLAFQNGTAAELLAKRRGTTDEKNLLLVGLLKVSGVAAAPIMIPTRDYRQFSELDHQVQQFNRIACYVESDAGSLLLDTSDPLVPYPYAPSDDLVYGGLLLLGTSSRAVSLSERPRENRARVHTTIAAGAPGSWNVSSKVSVNGYDQKLLGPLLQDSTSGPRMARRLIPDGIEYELRKWKFHHDQANDSSEFDLNFTVWSPPDSAGVQKVPVFPLRIFDGPFTSDARQFPVDYHYRRRVDHQTVFVCPDSTSFGTSLPDSSSKMDGFSNILIKQMTEAGATMLHEIDIRDPIFHPKEYPRLKRVMENVEQTLDGSIFIRKK